MYRLEIKDEDGRIKVVALIDKDKYERIAEVLVEDIEE